MDEEKEHIDSIECWCGPEEIFTADNGSAVIVHKGPGDELPPSSVIAQAIADAISNS